MKKNISALLLTILLLITSACPSLASEKTDELIFFEPLQVKATKIEIKDTEATYATEIYTYEDIVQSGTKTIYEFLNQNTSINISTNFGNTFKQLIDIRGFGLQQGFGSVAISVNGRRLNNIDQNPQNLSFIPLRNIDRIEITKGSGSVVYGDGATAGSIQIYTRESTETSISASAGNFGRYNTAFNTGYSGDNFKVSILGDVIRKNGFSDPGPDGNRDTGESNNYKGRLDYMLTETSDFFIELQTTDQEYRNVEPITLSTFENNPGSNFKTNAGATDLNNFLEHSDIINLGGTNKFGNNLEASLNYSHEDRSLVTSNHQVYDTNIIDGNIKYNDGPLTLVAGGQSWSGKRRCDTCSASGTATKKNKGLFIQGNYKLESTTLSLGARREWVDYEFNTISDSEKFEAFDIGINRSFNKNLSMFSNFNYAFQTPNVDYFFDFNGNFNGFIETATSATLNIGLNHITNKNRLKITVFGSKLHDEIYFNPRTFANTNIDRSSKYGIELQNNYSYDKSLSFSLNYAYIRAIIDREDSIIAPKSSFSNRCINNCAGNEIPGVSNHNLTFAANYSPTEFSKIILTQNFRSRSYGLNDYSNTEGQKTKAHITTDLMYRYSITNYNDNKVSNNWNYVPRNIDITAKVENLFERSHGVWVADDNIYASNFTRNWSLGAEFKF